MPEPEAPAPAPAQEPAQEPAITQAEQDAAEQEKRAKTGRMVWVDDA